MPTLIYKIATREAWDEARALTRYEGSADDARDGFIHLSTAPQLGATLAKHFAGQEGLVLLAVDADALGDSLKWEPSRGGELFPHLYGPLTLDAVTGMADLPLDAKGRHDAARALQRLDEAGKAGQSPEAAPKTPQGLAP